MHNGNNKSSSYIPKKSRKCNDLQCMEKGCTYKFYNKQLFISHLKFDHQIDFDIRHLNFTSVDGNVYYIIYIFRIYFKIYLFNLKVNVYFQNFYYGKKTLN